MTTLHLKKSIGRSPLRLGLLLIPLVLACFALLLSVQAAPDPATPPVSNTRDGQGSLAAITTGINNSAFGTNALNKLTIGSNNAAQGNSAQFSLTDGIGNTGLGVLALRLNVHGDYNTAVGFQALNSNTDNNNVAVGYRALFSNTGSPNTAVGTQALLSNTGGDSNNAVGYQALFSNTLGVWNNAVGYQALYSNVSGNYNTAIGDSAGLAVTGSGNVCIGEGVFGVAGENDTTRIRNVYSSAATERPVYVNSDGKLGTVGLSSRRFKDDIKPMDKTSEAILALKPVTFRYKKEIERNGGIMFGLIAEEVEKVAPDLVTRDAKGEAETVRYEQINAMLLNEFLKEHRKVQEQGATIAELRKGMEVLAATVKEQAAQIQKVGAVLEVSKPAPQTVLNNQ